MPDILEGATNQFRFHELPNGRIILSEEVYRRLIGIINLCAFSGKKELEYGTLLYGREIEPNVIYFAVPSKYDDYTPKRREFEINVDDDGKELKMHKEIMNKIEDPTYDCIAHIHAHPYIGGTCRFFSNQDLKMVQSLQHNFQKENGNKKYYFGGLLTVGPENLPNTDEISFVFYDEQYGWYKITNITIFQNNREIPLERVGDRPKIKVYE